jgi:hypothetical protein
MELKKRQPYALDFVGLGYYWWIYCYYWLSFSPRSLLARNLLKKSPPPWKKTILPTIDAASNLKLHTKKTVSSSVKSMEKSWKGIKVCLVLCPVNKAWELVIDNELQLHL